MKNIKPFKHKILPEHTSGVYKCDQRVVERLNKQVLSKQQHSEGQQQQYLPAATLCTFLK